ncbi:hypothetical protein [Thalassotalea sp. ND16A]|uniref:hypothetical protein n=1 Tax=Thalassotalea sp. ND16A TaxID=1535422 RepID=UPI00051A5598|nr:hypothetical protein [Thalassotalea sp. ND16A]KGJ99049.1 hypothetical protein ND16A_0437 [Thalassotalea sp. ND16A]
MIDNKDLLEQFRRFIWQNKTANAIELSIETVDWNGSEPRLKYQVVKILPHDANEQQVEAAMQDLCANSNYFATCALCKKPELAGKMYDEYLCQRCAKSQ